MNNVFAVLVLSAYAVALCAPGALAAEADKKACDRLAATMDEGMLWRHVHEACKTGDLASVKIAHACGHDLNVMTKDGHSPLHVAVINEQLAVADYLLNTAKVTVDTHKIGRPSAVHYCTDNECLGLLLKAGANAQLKDGMGWAPLHYASFLGDSRIVRMMVQKKIDLAHIDVAGSSGSVELVRALVDAGADVAARTGRMETPLHLAAFSGHERAVTLLLAHKADVHARTVDGLTPLHFCRTHCHAIVRAIVFKGGDVNARDSAGRTPLHHACTHANDAFVKALMAHHANPDLIDSMNVPAGNCLPPH